MYTLTDRSQFQAEAIKYGDHKLPPAQQEIMDWITKQFGVHALDFFCETRENSKGLRQQLVHVIVETVDDVKRMQANRADHTLVAERFSKYFQSADLVNTIPDPLKSDVFPTDTNPFPQITVTYRPLKGLDRNVLQEMHDDEEQAVLKTFESVWKISVTVIFYYTDAQVKENLTNGTSSRISEALGRVAKKYGFDPGSQYRFDSKESFDRDYESNWYYYWK
jgi:hypothetical protein